MADKSINIVILCGGFGHDIRDEILVNTNNAAHQVDGTVSGLKRTVLLGPAGQERVNPALAPVFARKSVEYILRSLEGVKRLQPLSQHLFLVVNDADKALFTEDGSLFAQCSGGICTCSKIPATSYACLHASMSGGGGQQQVGGTREWVLHACTHAIPMHISTCMFRPERRWLHACAPHARNSMQQQRTGRYQALLMTCVCRGALACRCTLHSNFGMEAHMHSSRHVRTMPCRVMHACNWQRQLAVQPMHVPQPFFLHPPHIYYNLSSCNTHLGFTTCYTRVNQHYL